MKSPNALSKLLHLGLSAAILVAAPAAYSQAVKKIDVDDPQFEDIQSPNLGGGKKAWKPKDWLEVEVKVKLDPGRAAPRDKHVDLLTVRWYVAVPNKVDPAGKKYFLMEKQINHVNVPLDEEFYLACYISPATIKRLTGKDRANKNAIIAVGGEITIPGAPPARFTSKGEIKDPWWLSDAMQPTKNYPLLNKNETPFKFLWWDRYLEIQPEVQ